MTEEETSEERREAQEMPFEPGETGWGVFHGSLVMVQLREPYLVPGFDYQPQLKEGGAVAIPVINGVMMVERAGPKGEVILLLRVSPNPNAKNFLIISVHPQDVLYCTHIHQEQSQIIQP